MNVLLVRGGRDTQLLVYIQFRFNKAIGKCQIHLFSCLTGRRVGFDYRTTNCIYLTVDSLLMGRLHK